MSDTTDNAEVLDTRKIPRAILAHMKNQTFTMSDGTEYTVRMDGAWVKSVDGMNNRQKYGTRSTSKLAELLKNQ